MEDHISASQGDMRSLPGKIESLLKDPGKGLHKGDKNKIRALKGDLEELIAKYLVEPSEVEDPALTASSWMKEARELSYDIRDFLDDLVSVNAHAKIQQTPRSKFSRFHFQLKRNRHQEMSITDQISSFRTRVKEAIQQHKVHLCKLRKWPSSSAAALDGSGTGRLLLPLEGGLGLVGMGSSIEDLSGWLANDGKPERRVVSIVGVGGVGKTTLANNLYCNLGGQFQCRAFVRTSRKPDHRRLLTSILSQVRPHHPIDPCGVPDLVEKIKEYLQNKTYFIIIDNLYAPSTWDIVGRALPKGNYCTRILITTEVEVVARICCAGNSKYIYKKKPLSEDESKELFSNVSVHQSGQCSKDLSELHGEIIRNIGGLPLAIIIMASLLARQPASIEQWNYMMSLPNSYLVKNDNLEMMRHVLNLSYNSIPHYLKACMLYLSLYEEDSIIVKDDLVKQWISEGFICATEGNDKEKVARSYFDELVNRGMIEPVHIDSSDEVLSCMVHYMVLHHIRYISIEENFITAIDHTQTATRLADKVRRLALHFGTEEDAKPLTGMRLSQVRSLAFFGSVRCMPSVKQFRFLRVLVLKLWADPHETSYCNLSGISELFQLRYLNVDASHVNVELPSFMQCLRDLVALQIEARVSLVPSDIVDMPALLYLNLPSEAHLPTGIGNMRSLRTLGYFDLSSNSEENVMDLGKLTNLQDLHLTCSTVHPADNLKKNMECLGLVLEKLSNLKCVTLVPAVSSDVNQYVNTHYGTGASSINISCNVLSSISPAPTYLQRFELFPRFCIFQNLPKWFGELHQLCILNIAVRDISTEDMRIVKALPALTALSLSVLTVPDGWIFIEEDGFLALRCFKFTCAAPCLAFVEGAMGHVQRLKVGFSANRLEQYNPAGAGFKHLSALKEISVEIGGAGADKLDLSALKSALLTAFGKHQRRTLIINLQWVHWIYHGDTEISTSLQKRNYQTSSVKGTITDEQHGRKDKQVDSRTSMPPESSSHPQNPEIRERYELELENLTLTKHPFRTLHLFMLAILQYMKRSAASILSKAALFVLLFVLVVIPGVVLLVTDGLHKKHVQEVVNYARFGLWWVSLGVASSIGLGSGLHTFVMYLGPHIALFTIKAVQCGRVDLKTAPYDTILLKQAPSWLHKKCSEFGSPMYPSSDHSVMIPAIDLLPQVQLEAVFWGIGTALGELAPYFISRAARLSGNDVAPLAEDGPIASTVYHTKRWLHSHSQHLNFFTILILASVPNPLFDLTGIMCGQFGISFWEFFFATLIGKAIIKTHIQTLFIISLCNNQLLYLMEDELIWIFGYIPGFSATLPSVIAKLHNAMEKYLSPVVSVSPSPTMEVKQWNFFALVWNTVVCFVLVKFFIKIVTSTARDYRKKEQDGEMKLSLRIHCP